MLGFKDDDTKTAERRFLTRGHDKWRVRLLRGAREGSIEVGKLADLVVLGRDPVREEPSTLISIPIERTMVGGR